MAVDWNMVRPRKVMPLRAEKLCGNCANMNDICWVAPCRTCRRNPILRPKDGADAWQAANAPGVMAAETQQGGNDGR